MTDPDKTPLLTDDRDPVDQLAEQFAVMLRRGEHPSVSDYAAAHPAYAEQLREVLPAVAQMEGLKRFRRATGLDANPALPDRFGDFRIVRELGRGGMGVVFEAVQESLGRPVALKVLAGDSQNDGIRRERFIREAHAAARLHHSNIVPVFGVGEQDNIPYYVMQLIRGQGLNAVAHRWRRERSEGDGGAASHSTLPTLRLRPGPHPPPAIDSGPVPAYGNWRFVAEVGLQAAEALHYAHKQGVLHRDIKPGNLLLDANNRVWVTDFGLAKVVDFNGITASGDILGTLQYLAPECLAGDSDPRSDVYGVGATLYELLTLIPPYPADTPAKLLKQVADTAPVPPRSLNPDIPVGLETIVLKAMAREPDRRYVSTRDLARDLQAFLDDRPIKARRETWTNRLWRWCRRNPSIALLGPTAVAALVLAAAGGWVAYARTQRALNAEARRLSEAESARLETEAASRKLDDNLRLSLAAFEAVFDAAGGGRPWVGIGGFFTPPGRSAGFGGPPWAGGFDRGPERGPGGPDHSPGGPDRGPGGRDGPDGPPGGGPAADTSARAAMLEAVLAFYDKFAEQNATNLQLQFESAKAHRRVGEARVWLGQMDKARIGFGRAIAVLKALREQDPNDSRYALELAQTYLGSPLDTSEVDEAAVTWAYDFARGQPPGANRVLPAFLAFKLGVMREKRMDHDGAEAAFREAIGGLAAPVEGDDRPPPMVTDQAWARYALAESLISADRWPDAAGVLRESIDELRGIQPRNGRGSMQQRDAESYAHELLSKVFLHLGDSRGAEDEARIARDMREKPKGPGIPGGPDEPKGLPPPRKKG